MDEQIANGVSSFGAELAIMAARGLGETIPNKFKAIRDKNQIDEICNSYEDIINELVAERGRAIAIAQVYESELQRYEITDEDISHLQNTIGNALDIIKSLSPDRDFKNYEQFKSLISVDTLKAMQLLGFDYKKAIGDPLTEVCAEAIRTKLIPNQSKSAKSQSQRRR